MTQQLLDDLLIHLNQYGSYWKQTTAQNIERLYKFYCKHLNHEPIQLITKSYKNQPIRDSIERLGLTDLQHRKVKVKYNGKWMLSNCVIHTKFVSTEDRMMFCGLIQLVGTDNETGEINWVKTQWLKAFYCKEFDKMNEAETELTTITVDIEHLTDMYKQYLNIKDNDPLERLLMFDPNTFKQMIVTMARKCELPYSNQWSYSVSITNDITLTVSPELATIIQLTK